MPYEYVDEIAHLQALIARHGSQYRLAKNLGIHHTAICKALKGKIPMPPPLLDAMGLERVRAYRRRAR